MRVLLLTRAVDDGAHVRLLAEIGGGLLERGAEVACLIMPAAGPRDAFSAIGDRVIVAEFTTRSWWTMMRTARKLVSGFRPDVIITDSERDLLLAAVAARRKAGIVRRSRPDVDARWGWRSNLAARLARVALLAPPAGGPASLPSSVSVTRGTIALPPVPHGNMRGDERGLAAGRGGNGHDTTAGMDVNAQGATGLAVIGCVPDRIARSAPLCLRSVAQLRRRMPELRLVLFGESRHLQAVRVHAAALGLSDILRVRTMSSLFSAGDRDPTVLWIAARGDEGMLAAVAGMSRGIPLVVDRESDVSSFVAHRITGIHADANELSTASAEIARLLADPSALESTRDASLSRAGRLHSWSAFVDRTVAAIESVRREPVRGRQARSAGRVA